MTIYTATITLILVMDPVGNIPVFLSILKDVAEKRRNRIIIRESCIAFLVLIAFLFFGQYILKGLNISESALNIAGGIILFLISIRMIFPQPKGDGEDPLHGEPFIVPLAIPLSAGPSAMATVLLLATREPTHMPAWFLAVVIACAVFMAIMLCAQSIMRIVGARVIVAMERLMGMLLTTVSVQMFLTGVQHYFNHQGSI